MKLGQGASELVLAGGGLLVVLAALAVGVVAGRLLASRPSVPGDGDGGEAWVGGMAATSSMPRPEAETLRGSKRRLEGAKRHSSEVGGTSETADSAHGPGD